ncbi:MAG: type II toxin-antitoxin system death-on-curing family toxin [Acidimicrobiia bacterium]
MTDRVELIDLDDVLDLARRLLGDPPPVRDIGLLGSAVARPQTTIGGHDAYPTVWAKAAALLQSVVANHALVDGNKRLGWLSTAVFLELNEASVVDATNDEVHALVMRVASTTTTVDDIAVRSSPCTAARRGGEVQGVGSSVGSPPSRARRV